MRSSEIRRVLSVGVVGVAIGVAGCGSSSKKTTSAASPKPSAATKAYHAGEFCTKKKAALYRAQGFKCVKVKGSDRLEKS